jgi:hypothetical protein
MPAREPEILESLRYRTTLEALEAEVEDEKIGDEDE